MTKLTVLLLTALLAAAQPAPQAESQRYIADVKYLSSDEMQGRGAGSKGLDRAAKYIEERFKELRLQPAGDNGSFRQSLQVTTGAKPGGGNHLESVGGQHSARLHLNTDFSPLSFSSNGEVTAPLVFAGYGVTAPEFHYDDYTHLDVKDKIVLVLRYEPKSFRKSETGKERAWTHHASLVSKAINARDHGAKGLLLVNGEGAENEKDTLIRFGSVAGPEDAGIMLAEGISRDVSRGINVI